MDRLIGELKGVNEGPLLIFIGGLHGNEAQGLFALENIFSKFSIPLAQCAGKAIALRGNLKAIAANKRYIAKDLNRIWKDAEILKTQGSTLEELEEYEAIKQYIESEIEKGYPAVYLIDLHTTSAPTIPFAVTRNSPKNKQLIEDIDIPYITGLDGFLDGTLLSWMCEKGHCGLAFEAGQHQSKTSMIKHEAFVQLSMFYTGFTPSISEKEIQAIHNKLDEEIRPKHNHFVLTDRYAIAEGETFKMEEGFTNFQRIYAGEILAKNQHGEILAESDANIFMPLYQKQGNDGFFIIKPAK
mgnify:CR=1 FL=1